MDTLMDDYMAVLSVYSTCVCLVHPYRQSHLKKHFLHLLCSSKCVFSGLFTGRLQDINPPSIKSLLIFNIPCRYLPYDPATSLHSLWLIASELSSGELNLTRQRHLEGSFRQGANPNERFNFGLRSERVNPRDTTDASEVETWHGQKPAEHRSSSSPLARRKPWEANWSVPAALISRRPERGGVRLSGAYGAC